MDFNTVMQTVLTLMVGALCWFIQRSIKKFDDGIAKLNDKVVAVDEKHTTEMKQLRQDFHALKEEMPLVYTLREDFLRVMNGVDEKLNKILYGRNGGGGSE